MSASTPTEATSFFDRMKQALNELAASLDCAGENRKLESDAAVAARNAQRELQRLDERAEDAERYASASLVVAVGVIEEAHAAVLEA